MKRIHFASPVPIRRFVASLLAGMGLGIALLSAGCATMARTGGQPEPADRSTRSLLRKSWGIEVASLHLSAHGHIVDFRYRVLDPEKAALLGDRDVKPTLTDLATGAVLRVPSYPKTGSMRQTGTQLKTGRTYFMLFTNTGMAVKIGSRVTVAVGDFKAENLIVQ